MMDGVIFLRLTMDGHKASRGISAATAELLVLFVTLSNYGVCNNGNAIKQYNFQNSYACMEEDS